MSRLRMLSQALESIENEYGEEQGTLEVEDVVEMEEELTEVSESADEVEEFDEDLAEADEVAEALESLAFSLEMIAENGGLNTTGAAMFNIAYESIMTRAGMWDEYMSSSLESFSDSSSRVSATRISLEGVVESIKKFIQMIIDGIKAAYRKVVDFFKQLFSATERLKKNAAKIKEKAKKHKQALGKAEIKPTDQEKFRNVLWSGSKMLKATDAAKQHKEFCDGALAYTTTVAKNSADTLGSLLNEQIKNPESLIGAGKFSKLLDHITSHSTKISKDTAAKVYDQGEGNYYESKFTGLGGYSEVIYTHEDEHNITFKRNFVRLHEPSTGHEANNGMLPSETADIYGIVDAVVYGANKTNDMKKIVDSGKTNIDQLIKKSEDAFAKLDDEHAKRVDKYQSAGKAGKVAQWATGKTPEPYGQKVSNLRKLVSKLNAIFSTIAAFSTSAARYIVTTGKRLLDVCLFAMKSPAND